MQVVIDQQQDKMTKVSYSSENSIFTCGSSILINAVTLTLKKSYMTGITDQVTPAPVFVSVFVHVRLSVGHDVE